MEDVKEFKEKLKSKIVKSSNNSNNKGGQTVGLISRDVTLELEDLGIKITIAYHRSQLKNAAVAMLLMELAIDDILGN